MSVYRQFSTDCRMNMCLSKENVENKEESINRSILKSKKNRSENEKAVERSLNLLCNVPSARELFDNVADVFGNLCFDHFFKGDCYKSLCPNRHYCDNFDVSHLSPSIVWSTTLYVICHASSPDLGILTNLIRHFDDVKNVDEILAFARSVVKLKRQNLTVFVKFLIDVLSRHVGNADAITRILMSIYSLVDKMTFDNLLKELKIVDDLSIYFDLTNFLEYRSYVISSTISNGTDAKNVDKKVEFRGEVRIVEFDADEEDDLQFNQISNSEVKNENFKIQSIVDIFGNFCLNWLLLGECKKSICSLRHDFDEPFLNYDDVDKISAAAEFYVDSSVVPNLKLIRIFVDVLIRTVKFETVLNFYKFSRRLSKDENVRLTVWIWSKLSKKIGNRWTAVEMILTPNVLTDDRFELDQNLLSAIMNEAIDDKCSLSSKLTKAICRQIATFDSLQPEMTEIILEFVRKFILKIDESPLVDNLGQYTEIFCAHRLLAALEKSVDNKFFLLVCVELKFAVERRLNLNDVVDYLSKFLKNDRHKARAVEQMLNNVRFLSLKTRKTVRKLLIDVGTNLAEDSYENGSNDEAVEIVNILRRINSIGSEVKKSLIFCRILSNNDDAEATNLFLSNFQFLVDNNVERSVELCRQLFQRTSAIEENLILFEGIFRRQKSADFPLKIDEFYEKTLRDCFRRPFDRNVRQSCIKLFLTVEKCNSTFLSPMACRCLTIIVVKEIFANCRDRPNYLPNLFQPVVSIILTKCIQIDAYPRYNSCDELSLYSFMTEEEITIYLLWWFKSFLSSRRSERNYNYEIVTIKVVSNVVKDGTTMPVHCRLRKVDNGIVECAYRLNSVVKFILSTPLSNVDCRRIAFDKVELSPRTVRALCRKVVRCLNLRNKRECSFCYDDKC